MIRIGTPDDLEALRGVYRRALLSNASDRERLLAHPELLVLGPEGLEGRTWVAVEDDQVVGFATWSRGEGMVELEDLFVDPPWTRRGVATPLVARVVDHLRSDGVTRLEVTAGSDALGFYRTVRFTEVGVAATAFGSAPRLAMRVD